MEASHLYKAENILGEGPMWHSQRNSFFWVDIEGKTVYEYNTSNRSVSLWSTEQRVSALFEYDQNYLIVALQGCIGRLDLSTGITTKLASLEADIPEHRTNDGKCDCKGRLWIGTMHVSGNEPSGSLYKIEISSPPRVKKEIGNLTISNGLAWSLDNRLMYFIDSPSRRVDAYRFDEETGTISFEYTAFKIPSSMGMPDGMTIDEEGMLWIAQWGGFSVNRWDPKSGKMLLSIHVPAPQVTSCSFGGEQYDELFITTASKGLDAETLKKYPLSGDVFIVKTGAVGLPGNKFRMFS